MVTRCELERHMAQLLEIERFKDYGPNGLQVEGKTEVRRIVSGVTASRALIDAAIAQEADAIVVHHGLFWRGQDGRITGWMKERVERLLAHQINLFAYHLPLDAHAELGNNAQWGRRLGVQANAQFGDYSIGFIGPLAPALSLDAFAARVREVARREVTCVAGDGREIRRVAWCSGGAQDWFEPAIAAGADVFVTGEISEPQTHVARETGVAFIACGHHASERFGAAALGEHLASQFQLEHSFIDIDNPA